ncbi:hypothetical protein [Polaromonas sp. SM01]|uniref:hypothetical protein n=1 Tax=Polaromonas sp. SM01 TaxID=3085630 RepID=UPI0029824E97|nr:hypothetical protein [Polaromonas sp. SM01]MDW5443185.1 hypothetical protein [Polaromonas sp. SM01]
MKKLVKLDPGGWLTEIDLKAMRREALTLRAYIEAASEGEARLFEYRRKVLPLIQAALDSTLPIPYKGDDPYSWSLMLEGLTPRLTEAFCHVYSRFMNRIAGSSTNSALSTGTENKSDWLSNVVVKDGERYKWVEFED